MVLMLLRLEFLVSLNISFEFLSMADRKEMVDKAYMIIFIMVTSK